MFPQRVLGKVTNKSFKFRAGRRKVVHQVTALTDPISGLTEIGILSIFARKFSQFFARAFEILGLN